MKYSLAFLFVAATAILVTSAPSTSMGPPPAVIQPEIIIYQNAQPPIYAVMSNGVPLNGPTLTQFINAQQSSRLAVAGLINAPRPVAQECTDEELTQLIPALARNQLARDQLRTAVKGLVELKHYPVLLNQLACYPVLLYELALSARELEARETDLGLLNIPTAYDLTIKTAQQFGQIVSAQELNELLTDQLTDSINGLACAELLKFHTPESLSDDDSLKRMHNLKRALRFFIGPQRKQFKIRLLQNEFCEGDDRDYIIAEKIWELSNIHLEIALNRLPQTPN